MAGVDPTGVFNADTFRTQIRATMQMGLPNAAGDAPAFRWVNASTYASHDPAGQPYNWAATPTLIPPPVADLAVVCAVQILQDQSSTGEVGEINQLQVQLTVLDADWTLLLTHGGRAPDQVLIKGVVYAIDYVPSPVGLFDVDVYTVYATSLDSDG